MARKMLCECCPRPFDFCFMLFTLSIPKVGPEPWAWRDYDSVVLSTGGLTSTSRIHLVLCLQRLTARLVNQANSTPEVRVGDFGNNWMCVAAFLDVFGCLQISVMIVLLLPQSGASLFFSEVSAISQLCNLIPYLWRHQASFAALMALKPLHPTKIFWTWVPGWVFAVQLCAASSHFFFIADRIKRFQ